MPPVPEAYLEGVRLFNEEEFFECHDALEELWTEVIGEERDFYQGLIHAAVALFHYDNGNFGGARRMYHSCLKYLQPYPSPYFGLDLETFREEFRRCFRELLEAGNVYPQDASLKPELIPRLRITLDDDPSAATPEN